MSFPKLQCYLFFFLSILIVPQYVISQDFVHSQRQNLIPNPSFEETNSSIRRLDMEMQNFDIMKDWQASINSPDAYNPAVENIKFIHRSPNFLKQFGPQEARTGEGKVGMYIAGGPFKEGVTAKLKKPLTAGKYYYFHMYVSLGEGVSNSCTSSIGSYFTARVPKITETSKYPLHIESSKLVCNTKGWSKVCGVYKAKGTEKYISLGYFADSPKGKSVKGGGFDTAYYFVDDVMLMEMRSTKSLSPDQVCNMALKFSPVEFLIGESEAYKEIQKSLDDYIQYIKVFNVTKVQLIGHADDAGSAFENEIMSAMRVANVKKYFIEQGVEEELIEIIAKGDTEPIVTEGSDLDQDSNNRVEIKIE